MLHRPTHPNGYVSHEFPQFCGNWARKKKKNSTQIPTQKAKKKIINRNELHGSFPIGGDPTSWGDGCTETHQTKTPGLQSKRFWSLRQITDRRSRGNCSLAKAARALATTAICKICSSPRLFFSPLLLLALSLARSLAAQERRTT